MVDLIQAKGLSLDLSKVSLNDLWVEIGKRLNLQFGKIQMAFHNGKPSTYANIDIKVKVETEEQVAC